MSNKYPRSLFAILLFIFSILNSFAGVYEYEFKTKNEPYFSKAPLDVHLGNLLWSISIKGNKDDIYKYTSFGLSKDKGQKFSTSHQKYRFNPLTIKTNDISTKITSISLTMSSDYGSYITCYVQVGNKSYSYGSSQSATLLEKSQTFTFSGNSSGEITINWKQAKEHSKNSVPIYLKTIRIEYEDELSVSISSAGYSTFSAAQAYTMPEGLQGGIVTVSGNKANVDFCYQSGDVVPAEEALMLKGKQGAYALTPATTNNSPKTENLLKAALTNGTIQAAPGHELFILSRKDNQLGFFYQYGCNDGSFVKDIAHKAYLDIPTSKYPAVQQGLRLNLEPTGITTPSSKVNGKCIYHISGKKMGDQPTALPKGIYIINGKKSIIK